MRHLFNAQLDEIHGWTFTRWERHRTFADLWMRDHNWQMGGR
jgi:hypothetical protein